VAAADDGTPWSLREASLVPGDEDAEAAGGAGQHAHAYELTPPKAPHGARADLEEFLPELEERFAAAIPEARHTSAGEGERAVLVAVGTGTKEELERSQAELAELAR